MSFTMGVKGLIRGLWQFCSYVFVLNGAESPKRADKAEWAGASATGLSACGAEPTHEASAEPPLRLSESTPSLLERCRA